jgi:DNA-binding NtrC family response regulator
MAKLRILYSEGDIEALKDLTTALEKAGHSVQQTVGRKSVEEAIKKNTFDLVVLGSTLNKNDRHHLPYVVKKSSPETSVLVMHADGGRHHYVDAWTDSGVGVESVMRRIEGMKSAGMMPAAMGAGAGK